MHGRALAASLMIAIATAAMLPLAPHAFAASQFVEDPDALDRPPPRYPRAALDAGIGGKVTMEVAIDADGRVVSATVVKAEPPGWFEEEAIRCVRTWRYKPLGENVRRTRTVTVEFQPS